MNLRTRTLFESVAAGGEMPIGYMIRVMRDQNAPSARRDKMALAAAAYLHSRLMSTPAHEDEEQAWEGSPPDGESPNAGANAAAANGDAANGDAANGDAANGGATNGGGLK